MKKIIYLVFGILAISACSSIGEVVPPVNKDPVSQDVTPGQSTATVENTPTTLPLSLWISDAVPSELAQAARSSGIQISNDPQQATLRLDLQTGPDGNSGGASTWIYALVAPFPALLEETRMDDLLRAWSGDATSALLDTPFWMDETTRAAMTAAWGEPSPVLDLSIAAGEDLLDLAWNKQPSLAIIPFEDLEPRWKVIRLDGQSPLHKDFDLPDYPLKFQFGLSGAGAQQAAIRLPETNRDPDKMTTLVMTGVTALVRTTALKMELNGRTYPGEAIRDWLVNADITHISNEIPFTPDCPYPEYFNYSLIFCSDPLNIELLEYIGTDVVELTGNHFQDWGSEATLFTLEMYNQRNWPYFGGGANLEDARKSITLEHNGNKLAFLGCNPAGPDFAWATETEPGASPCDWSWVQAEIARLGSLGYLPIMTFQYYEGYGIYPGPGQLADFRRMAEAGAVIVSGSQAHLPQTMEFYGDSFLHYGLGNLFFDQMDFPVVGTRREFLDRHVFYNGKYIQTELLTAMLEDYSRPRPMTETERKIFLQDVFTASGW